MTSEPLATAVACGQAILARRTCVRGTPAALTVAARGTPQPAQAPRAVVRSKSAWRRERLRSTHSSRRKPCAARARRTRHKRSERAGNRLVRSGYDVRRVGRAVVRPAQRGSGGGRGHSVGRRAGRSAAARLLRPMLIPPFGSHWPARSDAGLGARRRVARSRGAPQRGRRAGDSIPRIRNRHSEAAGPQGSTPASSPDAESRGAAWKEGAPQRGGAQATQPHRITQVKRYWIPTRRPRAGSMAACPRPPQWRASSARRAARTPRGMRAAARSRARAAARRETRRAG
jgi:hypothetical protein